MIKAIHISVCIYLILTLGSVSISHAQESYYDSTEVDTENTSYDSTMLNPNQITEINRTEWKSIKKGIDYREKKKPEKQNKKTESKSNFSLPSIDKIWLEVILWSSVFLLVVFIIYKLINSDVTIRSNKKIEYSIQDLIENIPENLHEIDLTSLLNESILNKNYTDSIRLYYLICLNELHGKNLITLKKNRTSKDFINDLDTTVYHHDFKVLTVYFEKVRYGEINLNQAEFAVISEKFGSFIHLIKSIPL